MSPFVLLPIQMFSSVVAFALLVRCIIWPSIRTKPRELQLIVVLWPQSLRHLGLTMLAPSVANEGLPTELTHAVAIGDAVTVVLVWAAIGALHLRSWIGAPLAWATTVVGALDLAHNLVLARIHQIAPHLGPQWYVVAFAVPAMIVFHVAALIVLLDASERR